MTWMRISDFDLQEIVERTQRGEDLEKRRQRPESLEEYFRRRNELTRKLGQHLVVKPKGDQ